MPRLNLTLDEDTFNRLDKQTRRAKSQRATVARDILREGLERRERYERHKRLAADYAAGRHDARILLEELESLQDEILGEEGA